MKKIKIIVAVFACWIMLAISCKKNNNQAAPDNIGAFVVPGNFPAPLYNFSGSNVQTTGGFILGRKLFYDNALSVNNSINCGSCHRSRDAFSDRGRNVSRGIRGCDGTRNTFPLFNLIWQSEFMWDGTGKSFEHSGENAMTNACEMGNTVDNIVVALRGIGAYPELFRQAFGTTEITADRLFKALAQFTGMMVSANSKYDKVMRNEGAAFTAAEAAGYILFKDNCSSCHQEPLFTDHTFRSNGLELEPIDRGREIATGNIIDRGAFRVPTLRNVEFTNPYMHNGSITTLEAVLEHYVSGIKNHINLDPELKKGGRLGIQLTGAQRNNLMAFLRTLTDQDFLQDARFVAP